ncbi:MAG: hypothetical protein HPY50_11370 [Firmicutes bacterium]|nr:hypothetical protein [Bacillota bacterium]
MRKSRWFSVCLALLMLFAVMLAPNGWGVLPSAQAGGANPVQLTAAASGQSIVLTWTVPTTATGLSGYYIYRGTSPGGESAQPLRDFPITGTTFTDTSASSGTYYYIVKPVFNSTTPGAASNEASATVPAGVTIILYVGQPTMTVNGVSKEIDPGQGTAPVLVDGRVFVPIRAIVEAMGGTVGYTAAEKKVSITLGSTAIDLWIGQTTARVNGVMKNLDVAPYISDTGRTMLPLRFVTENLGCQVAWESATQKVTITYGGGGATTPPTIITTTTTTPTVIPGTPAGNTTSGPSTTTTNIPGLAAQYKFNGDFKDATGKGNDATQSGSVSFVDDSVMGKCAVFNGGYLTVESSDALNLGSNFTISVWVMVDPSMAIPINKDGSIISKLDDRGLYNNLHWYTRGTFGMVGYLDTNVGERSITNKAFTDYKMHLSWTQLVFSGDGENLYLYCNGSLISTNPVGTGVSIIPSTGDVRIGCGNDINNQNLFFIGKMADLRIYNRTLGQDEITPLYSAGAAR